MSLTLRWRSASTLPVRGESLKPETFASLSPGEAAHLVIGLGNTRIELGELFEIDGSTGDDTLKIEGNLDHVQGIGQGMSRGKLAIEGNAGALLGAGMSGGELELHGHAGDWLGAEMTGGRLRVRGNVGDFAGAALPGSRLGMRGGEILVEGSGGTDIGLSMRRGLIAILGDAGDGLGRSLIAGTILLGGTARGRIGAGMKRGSLVLLTSPPDPASFLLPTFHRAGVFPAGFLVLYKRQLAEWGFEIPVP